MAILGFDLFESDETNTKAIAIFTTYGLTVVTCIALIARTLTSAYNSLPIAQRTRSHLPVRRNDVLASGVLALLSFTLNAYHVIDALVTSYGVWSLQKKHALPTNIWTAATWFPRMYSASNELKLGNWLRDTDWLQEVAFAVAGRSRDFWWAQQLSAGTMIWSTFVAVEGRRRNVPYLWAFIVLAHLVGLSFAQNLFNIVVLLTPAPIERKKKRSSSSSAKSITWTPHPTLFIAPFVAAMFSTAVFPYMEDNRSLFVFSAIPAALTFAPLFVSTSSLVPASWGRNHSSIHRAHSSSLPAFALSSRLAATLHFLMTFASIFFNTPPARQTNVNLLWNTQSATSLTTSTRLRVALTKLLGSLSDNPVVRKIGWDVMLSGVSLCVWAALRGPDVSDMLTAAGVPGVQAMTGAVKDMAESAVSIAETAQEKLSSAADDVTEAAISLKESAIPMLESARDTIAARAKEVADSDAAKQVAAMGQDAAKQMAAMAQDAANSAKEMTSSALSQMGFDELAESSALAKVEPAPSPVKRGRGRLSRAAVTAAASSSNPSPPSTKTRRGPAASSASAATTSKLADDDDEDDSEDEDYAPSRRAAATHEEHEHEEVHGPVELSEGTESAALAWGLLALGGLGVAGSGVWGAELVGR